MDKAMFEDAFGISIDRALEIFKDGHSIIPAIIMQNDIGSIKQNFENQRAIVVAIYCMEKYKREYKNE